MWGLNMQNIASYQQILLAICNNNKTILFMVHIKYYIPNVTELHFITS